MNCIKCYQEIPDGAKFCPYCGSKTEPPHNSAENKTAETAYETTANTNAETAYGTETNKNSETAYGTEANKNAETAYAACADSEKLGKCVMQTVIFFENTFPEKRRIST